MQTLSVCSRCRLAPFYSGTDYWKNLASLTFRRYRSAAAAQRTNTFKSNRPKHNPALIHQPADERGKWKSPNLLRQDSSTPEDPTTFFKLNVKRWTKHHQLPKRLQSFGIPREHILLLLDTFALDVQSGNLSDKVGFNLYGLARFTQDTSVHGIDIVYSTIFFTWASHPDRESLLLEAGVPRSVISHIQALTRAMDRSYPTEEFVFARKMHRKIIMHVGPTNSGKTHNALRALAASNSGVYAGPLRLLAHEIWERLNLGQIVPMGMEEEDLVPVTNVDTNSALDIGGTDKKRAMRKLGNPKFMRKCNMRTGEEQKIVDQSAPLLSCTVEMLNLQKPYDVGVVDEIQMIADEYRGQAWTAAVLGLCAKELHLCGEETAVPLVQELLKDTGDEIVVNRYQRLTPLRLGASLNGDLSQVRKGDCLVAFSRSRIFSLKRQVEKQTSMRCAVVYGMLPPEIRSEQAALFNDPHSGYDVIIGSDAIGMGLNLKIRRVIFDAVHKWNGWGDRQLSISQTKQIAGRAGRYGLHDDSQLGGEATTLNGKDIGFLKDALNAPMQPVLFARISPTKETFTKLFPLMDPKTTTEAYYHAHRYISRLPSTLRYAEMGDVAFDGMCEFLDKRATDLPLADRLLFSMAPIPWRDRTSLKLIHRMLDMFNQEMNVNLARALEGSQLLTNLEKIEARMKSNDASQMNNAMLKLLESLHKALVTYVWISFRRPVVWNCQAQAVELKERVERALDWSLQALTINAGWTETKNREPRLIDYSTLLGKKREAMAVPS